MCRLVICIKYAYFFSFGNYDLGFRTVAEVVCKFFENETLGMTKWSFVS